MSFNIVSAALTVNAIRTNGYKDTAHAAAELMDNAIQAGATRVDLIGMDREEFVRERRMGRLKEIAVLDNGAGMDGPTLRIALMIGNGTRLDAKDHTGIGRFGMGLPASSLSQCRRVDVWSWRNGTENALHTCLDLDKIVAGDMETVPQPEPDDLPERYRHALGAGAFGDSGTLVVWSRLDRCVWRTANPLFRNSESLIGRVYRRQIARKAVVIRFIKVNGDTNAMESEKVIKPNDPLYLTPGTSCPAPWGDTPMFEPWGDPITMDVAGSSGGRHRVTLRFAIAKSDARISPNAGALPHGRHAKDNVGVSLMRANRELDLDQGFVSTSDPRERWWGVEVDFPPALDDVFGVTNNKQNAHNFSELANSALKEEEGVITDEDDPRVALRQVGIEVDKVIREMRGIIENQRKGSSNAAALKKRADAKASGLNESLPAVPTPEEIASEITAELSKEGDATQTDRDAQNSATDRAQAIAEPLMRRNNTSSKDAEIISAEIVRIGYKYHFASASLKSSAFFEVESAGGALLITLNNCHPAYPKLLHALDEDKDNLSNYTEDQLRERLASMTDGVKFLLMAWARYEDRQPNDTPRRQAVYQAREDWGRMAQRFLQTDDEDDA